MSIAAGLPTPWREALDAELSDPYVRELEQWVTEQRHREPVYPPSGDELNAFRATPLDQVRVVILGQDPYHGPGQAMGLSFSVPDQVQVPPSLRSIFREVSAEVNVPAPTSGDLTPWTRDGVLLLNTTLTVAGGRPGSHRGHGWERFTAAAVDAVNRERDGVMFLAWGAHAQRQCERVTLSRHRVLTAPHPSPLSAYRGFFGCGHFRLVNEHLKDRGQAPVNWARTGA